MKNLMLDFLRRLPTSYSGIRAVILFGSFLGNKTYRDVDVILVFDNPDEIRATRSIARAFKNRFSLDLHIQLFFAYDAKNLESFLDKAGSWELLYGQRFTSEHPHVFSRPHG